MAALAGMSRTRRRPSAGGARSSRASSTERCEGSREGLGSSARGSRGKGEKSTGVVETGEEEGPAGRGEIAGDRHHGERGLRVQRQRGQGVQPLETLHEHALQRDALGFLGEGKVEHRIAVLQSCFLYTHDACTPYDRCVAVRTAATTVQIMQRMVDHVFGE